MKVLCSILIVAFSFGIGTAAEVTSLAKLKGSDLETRLLSDRRQVEVISAGLRDVLDYMRAIPEIFPTKPLSEPRFCGGRRKRLPGGPGSGLPIF